MTVVVEFECTCVGYVALRLVLEIQEEAVVLGERHVDLVTAVLVEGCRLEA